MNRRDEFAKAAMQGLLECGSLNDFSEGDANTDAAVAHLAKVSVEIADALITELGPEKIPYYGPRDRGDGSDVRKG